MRISFGTTWDSENVPISICTEIMIGIPYDIRRREDMDDPLRVIWKST
jgi:hypothetical protein